MKDYILEQGYDPVYGARPLKRYLQSHVETLLARKIIAEDLAPDTTLTVDLQNKIAFFYLEFLSDGTRLDLCDFMLVHNPAFRFFILA